MKIITLACGIALLFAGQACYAKFEELRLLAPAPPSAAEPLLELAPACVQDPVVGPERGKIIIDNREALRARAMMIDNANCEILVEYYTVASDRISIAGLAVLVEAASRGVKVKILLDGITHQIKPALAAATLYHPRARQNIEIRLFNPISILFPHTWLARLHDKAIMVDGHQIILGGRNISNKYYGIGHGGFFDADMYLEGEFAKHAREYFYGLWDSEHVSPYHPSRHDYDTVMFCRQDEFRYDDGCQYLWKFAIPRIMEYTQALDAVTEKLALARSGIADIVAQRKRLVAELHAKEDPSDEEVRLHVEQVVALSERSRAIRSSLAIDVTDTRAVITQADLDSGRAFVANGPVNLFYDEPAEVKSAAGVAMLLKNFLEDRIKQDAVVTIISPYVVLGRPARDLISHFIEDKNVTFKIYTNSSVSSDNVFAQAFYRHQYSKNFLVESGIEVIEFKGYRSPEEEEIYQRTGEATTIHIKAALIENPGEDPIILMGTFNVDLRSAHYNRELVAVVEIEDSARQIRKFKDLTQLIEKHGYRAGLVTHDEDGNMNEWYREYLKTPTWKRMLMKLLRGINHFTVDWLRRQA